MQMKNLIIVFLNLTFLMTLSAEKIIQIQSDHTQLAVRIYGQKHKQSIILLHGGPGVPDEMKEVVEMLQPNFRVITFDQRGTGGASCNNCTYSIEEYLTDINNISAHFQLEKFHLFGHSWGGLYAQIYAQSFPEKVESLFLCSPGSGTGSQWKQTEKEVLAFNKKVCNSGEWLKMGWNSLLGMMGNDGAHQKLFIQVMKNYHKGFNIPIPDAASFSKISSTPINKTRKSILNYPVLKQMKQPGFPIQITFGDQDIYGSSQQFTLNRYPSAHFTIIPASGHIPWKHNKEAFEKILLGFYSNAYADTDPRVIKPMELLNKMITEEETPGVQYQITKGKEVLFSYAKGHGNINSSSVIDHNTRFNIFSTTKTFTALAILQLQDKGMLSLEDKMDKYFLNVPGLKEVSVKDLLCHQSGLKNPLPLKWIHLATEGEFDYDTWINQIITKNQKLKKSPGIKFAYSNIGYLLLGEIIEKVSGVPYERYIQKEIVEHIPNINYLGFKIPDSNYAIGYQKRNFMSFLLNFMMDKKRYTEKANADWISFNPYYLNGKSYGGLISNASSLTAYLQALIQADSPLLSKAMKTSIFEEQATKNGNPTGMALGWFTGELNGQRYFCHAGGGGGYYCEIRIYPESKTSSVLIMNRSGFKDERILDRLDVGFID
jgi:CubicO group peptidase (beta-lactamase class C family)